MQHKKARQALEGQLVKNCIHAIFNHEFSNGKLTCSNCQHIAAPSMALFVYRYGPEPRKRHTQGILGCKRNNSPKSKCRKKFKRPITDSD